MLMEGHTAELVHESVNYQFDLADPYDLRRRGKKESVLRQYREIDENGTLLNPWSGVVNNSVFQYLYIDGKPISEINEYILTEDYYWAMGDNRDDSLDSRYWGFIPHKYMLGEALFVFMSLDLESWIPRLNRIGTRIY
jgi:hypothetical protein